MVFICSSVLLRQSVGLEFQEEFSDMLLLNMLRSATKASGDKDRVGTFILFFY